MLLLTLTGCGATIHSQLVKKDSRLSDYKKVHLMIATAGGSISVTDTGMGSGFATANQTPSGTSVGGVGSALSVSHAMSGNDQIIMAAQDVAFALRDLGFETVDKPEEADAIALFSIGTVRYDPLAGWIADRAFLQFKESKTGTMVVSIKADGQLITPTIGTLVDNIVSEVRKYR
jgi:hypothetical protein